MNGNSESHRRVRRQGPATLRGKQIPPTTTDQRLLDRRGPSDWVHTDPWRVMRIQAEFVEGFGLLAELGPAVSVFGSARTARGSLEYETAERIASGLARAGYAVITGGGPGVMEAANNGAFEAGGDPWAWASSCRTSRTSTSSWTGPELPLLLRAQDDVRQVLPGVRGLPGGFGTMDELFEALTLVATGKITKFPIVLVGRQYWSGLLSWLQDTMLARANIGPSELSLINLADEPDEVVAIIREAHNGHGLTPNPAP